MKNSGSIPVTNNQINIRIIYYHELNTEEPELHIIFSLYNIKQMEHLIITIFYINLQNILILTIK